MEECIKIAYFDSCTTVHTFFFRRLSYISEITVVVVVVIDVMLGGGSRPCAGNRHSLQPAVSHGYAAAVGMPSSSS